MHQKKAQEVQNLVENRDEKRFENSFKACSSAVLSSQIKKIIPSKVYENRKSSIAAGLEKVNVALEQKNSKIIEYLSKEKSILEPEAYNVLVPETVEEAVDPNIIKILPVPLPEKKIFKDTLTLPPSKVPWKERFMQGIKYNYSDISYHFKVWNDSLKEIEGYFGAGTVSYFVFLRWLLLMNCFMLVLIIFFIVLPCTLLTPFVYSLPPNFTLPINDTKPLYEVFEKKQTFSLALVTNHSKMSEKDIVKYCHRKYFKEIKEAKTKSFFDNLQNLLQGTGWMEPTIMFLGNYPIASVSGGFVYNVPLAFVFVYIAIYLFCFIILMAYSSFGVYEAIMSQEYSAPRFANEVFSAWDYCIQGSKNAEIHRRSFTNNIRTTLSEIVYKKKAEARSQSVWIKLYCIRFLVNLSVIALISGSYYMIFTLVHLQLREENYPYQPGIKTLMLQYMPVLSVTAIRTASPLFFSFVTQFEKFHARTTVNLSLARSAFIGLSSVVVLVASFQHQIFCQPVDICGKGKSHCHAPMCWETYVGQELYKLNVSEFLVSLFFFFLNVGRNYITKKFDNRFTRWIGSAQFVLPQEILALIYLQTITWLGVLYSPLLPLMLILKFIVLFYTKKATVMKYSSPATTIYKASRFNSVYIFILMITFLIVVTIQFYTCRNFLIHYNWRRCSILKVSVNRLTQELILLAKDRQFLLQKISHLVEEGEEDL
ncbi:transmembrane channel-like protein 7 isoform X2 [Parasteatoda tepidariorum]|uniref:transmembrane channel-like protein 7 isoform X2 n=1 Tax=Parasteatoda tepidariorum TaxID=114398 RepID=UPI001C72382F|nr:transmembrane channel-like protein 7 isoform X2 [Parasteatoda tepidariorum]